ncbi:hypothetical protein BO86DRAFT_215494 [Aspergillus japonicus CBS 114.51]|uniref:Uncharacterized protein n=1 Tax=Aspergillus japonicus CBS 114.51 TaxID=1448312 RepID=A0A8T8WQA1_ASPJA|nr:hypothetical protein BO86DRAFT_215494 [Aspergillus japonicus CBS 114.51]RAH77549.1 hypothetical protein BO86DRAFT_215494 [Aspergillus japonicus CBS 114.51]
MASTALILTHFDSGIYFPSLLAPLALLSHPFSQLRYPRCHRRQQPPSIHSSVGVFLHPVHLVSSSDCSLAEADPVLSPRLEDSDKSTRNFSL